MGRGVSAGGGQSSLGYLFGSGEAPKPAINNAPTPPAETLPVVNADPSPKPVASQPDNVTKQIPAGINNSSTNNYIRADGQNTGNFLTAQFTKAVLVERRTGHRPRFMRPLEAAHLWITSSDFF